MANAIHAIFENGVFRPTEPVNLPERCEVELTLRPIGPAAPDEGAEPPGLDDLYAVLGKRFHSGEHDTAARHNEHQP